MKKQSNPFKFGTFVDGEYFTNRVEEMEELTSIINSANHLVLIGPRRFGKTSLIRKITDVSGRPVVHLDAFMITSAQDLASQLVSRLFRLFPLERLNAYLREFSIVPTIKIDPVSGNTEISFTSGAGSEDSVKTVEDAFNLVEKLSSDSARLIVVIDEFQDLLKLGKGLDKRLRSVIQHHKKANYVFTGSQESMMRDLFERKKSPFYHFAIVRFIERIPAEDFKAFLEDRFRAISDQSVNISESILAVTESHPYYTQQLAWQTWEEIGRSAEHDRAVDEAVQKLVRMHDIDYDRVWANLITTDRKILLNMSETTLSPMGSEFMRKAGLTTASTVKSALDRLINAGHVIQEKGKYRIDDPFFSRWIHIRRNR